MTVAREEIFGPVLVIIWATTRGRGGEDRQRHAVRPGGLCVGHRRRAGARKVASRLRAGQVNINSAAPDLMAPFGGFKQSGNGREWGGSCTPVVTWASVPMPTG
jgi:aldehyde dehydrogenase (NAD+)